MKRRLFSMIVILTLVIGFYPASVFAAAKKPALRPGETVTYQQKVPINVVFIGYERGMINTGALRKQLPKTYEPVVRFPQFYGLPGRDLGLNYKFEYNITFAKNTLADQFFGYLEEIGTLGDPTLYQLQYNDQQNNVLDVSGPVLYIDGPSVEAWLADNLKVSPMSYTVVFINWHSRPDFQFHVYTHTNEPDPDTGLNFGEVYDTRKMIAWGGTSSRTWFFDLSAGPEWNIDNWNVDDPDLNGDGIEEYRMPPIWEYSKTGYREPAALSPDLGLVTRFVAINLLFAQSPLYDPLVTAPGVGGDKIVHINMFEDDPDSLGTDWIDRTTILSRLAELEPYYNWQIHLEDQNPIDADARQAFRIFAGLLEEDDCWNDFGVPFAELFCFFDANLATYVPAYPEEDYVIPLFAFNTTDDNMGNQLGLLGFADDNWVDGTQSYVFDFGSAGARAAGYGFTTLTVHEVGHHIGLSHPHDGYDSELELDYGPGGEFYFVWAGDESDTAMSYLWISTTYSRFDEDNLYRWEFAGYLNWANSLLDDILADPNVASVQDNLTQAESHAAHAVAAFNSWDYLAAASNARLAYEQVAAAADELGISTDDLALRMVPSLNAPHEGDYIRPGN